MKNCFDFDHRLETLSDVSSVNGRRIQPQLNINCVRLACCVVAGAMEGDDDDDENQAGEKR